jgi:hypothetical protein
MLRIPHCLGKIIITINNNKYIIVILKIILSIDYPLKCMSCMLSGLVSSEYIFVLVCKDGQMNEMVVWKSGRRVSNCLYVVGSFFLEWFLVDI